MKKLLPVIILLLMAGSAQALTDISGGIYGGLNTPIVQDDAKSGTGLGFKLKVAPTLLIGGALFYENRSFGDPEQTFFEGTPLERTEKGDGGKVSVFGIEAILLGAGGGIGPHFYFMLGISNYKWTRDNYDDISKVGYHLGPGFEIVMPSNIGIEAKAKLEIVPTDGGGSRKNGLIYVGANYHFGLM